MPESERARGNDCGYEDLFVEAGILADNTGTNRELDEKLLEESLEDLYENAPCGYVSTLLDGTFAKVNRTFLVWTGYQREELLGG